MTKKIIALLLLIIAFLTAVIIIISVQQEKNLVINVIDGDTFLMSNGEKVRLIGIDAPEKNEYYYNESKSFLESLILNKITVLEKDTSDYDIYGRLLRYAYIDGEMINLLLVENGYAYAKEYPPDTRYADLLKQAENNAKANNFGIWYEQGEGDELCVSLGCPEGTNFVGSVNSNKYHQCDSRFARMISPENLVCFGSKASAVEQGYEPSE